MIFSEITDKMYANHKIDGTFSALGKAVGDDYNVSDRAFGITKNSLANQKKKTKNSIIKKESH